jgi:plasmid stabilization system protein ParE
MAQTVRWTVAASEDLVEAAEFIAKYSPFYATALVREGGSSGDSI